MPMMMDESAAEFLQDVTAYESYINQKYDTPSLKLSAYQKLVRDIATGNWQQSMLNNDFLDWCHANDDMNGQSSRLSRDLSMP